MTYQNTTAYPTRGTRIRIGSEDMPGATTISGLGGGTASEIDITTLSSSARETFTGLPDPGSVTIDGVLPFQHPIVNTLDNAQLNSTELACAIYVGGVPAGDDLTDGSGVTTHEDIGVTASVVSTFLTFTSSQDATNFVAVSEGDIVEYGSSTASITKLATASDKLVITTSATATTSETEIDIVRPGIKQGFSGRVLTFERSGSTDETFRFTLTLRVTGQITTTVGNPDVTVT